MYLHLHHTSTWVTGVRWVGNPSAGLTRPGFKQKLLSIGSSIWMEGIYADGTSSFRYTLNNLHISSTDDWEKIKGEIDSLLNRFRSYNLIEVDALIKQLYGMCNILGYDGILLKPGTYYSYLDSSGHKSATYSELLEFFERLDEIRKNMIMNEVHE